MTIEVKCDDCGKQYNLKDAAAGKTFDCKDCGSPISVPRSRPKPTRPKTKGGQDPWDTAFSDDDDDLIQRPPSRSRSRSSSPSRKSRSKRKRKSKGTNLPIILACVGGGIVVLLFCGGFFSAMMKSGAFGDSEADDIANWKRTSYPQFNVSIMMPDNSASKRKITTPDGGVVYRSFTEGVTRLGPGFYGCEITCTPSPPELLLIEKSKRLDLLYNVFKESLGTEGSTIISERTISLGTLKGKEFHYNKEDMTLTLWSFVLDDVIVDINFYERKGHPKAKIKKQFLESIEIKGNRFHSDLGKF